MGSSVAGTATESALRELDGPAKRPVRHIRVDRSWDDGDWTRETALRLYDSGPARFSEAVEAKIVNKCGGKVNNVPRQEYYSYSNTYEYSEEVPYEGASADGVEGATTLIGDVTWGADISWNEVLGKYEVVMTWNDHGNHFGDDGEGPKEDSFIEDLYSYLENQGISSEEVTY